MDSAGSDDWDWVFSPRADDQFASLEPDVQNHIISKLDEVVSSEWREPNAFLKPLTGSPFQKLRVGDHRLGCRLMRDERVLRVESIRKRSGPYTADD